MDLVIQLLFALALISVFFQISQWKFLSILSLALSIGLVAYLMFPWTVSQSMEQLNIWMDDTIKMQNLAVIQVLEAVLFIAIDLSLLKEYFGQQVSKLMKYSRYFLGVFWIAAVLYTQMISFYSFSALAFESLAIYFSIGLVFCFMLIPIGIKKILPEDYLRMELRYILSFGQILGGIIITIFCQGLPYHPQENQFELTSLLLVLATIISMVFLGWLWSRISQKINVKWKY